MHIFYTPDIDADTYTLSEEESKHAIRVLRLQAGHTVVLVDGRGGYYTAEITDPNPKRTSLKVLHTTKEFGRRNHHLHLAVAPTKNIERMEWFLEKATEIGIDTITPLICERSERKEIKTERLNKIITSAVKQSIKAYHPMLNEAIFFSNFLNTPFGGQKFIAHCMEGDKKNLKDLVGLNGDYLILIGPEGDFSPAELALAEKKGYHSISLGNSRLRTETAALEACFEINFLNR
ncbi:MAG: 16S rRNA (uracil(1498)-N(3))-methyltransferase [Sphingobacteriaceae bacterium]